MIKLRLLGGAEIWINPAHILIMTPEAGGTKISFIGGNSSYIVSATPEDINEVLCMMSAL